MKGLQALLKLHDKHSFDINLGLSTKLCEFVGAFIGDGFTRQYHNHYLTQFTGDARYEEEYLNTLSRRLPKNCSTFFQVLKHPKTRYA